MALQLILVRHGETAWSRTGRHTGRSDLALTDVGRNEAEAVARTLDDWPIDRVYSSPLVRARETAELAGFGAGVELDDDLMEWDYGVYEGKRTTDTRETIADWSVWTHEIIGGESVDDVGDRADAFLRRVASDVDRDVIIEANGVDDHTAVVFAHGHLLAVLIARWCGLPAVEGRRFALATATVSLLGAHREDRVVRALNHRCGDRLHPPARVT